MTKGLGVFGGTFDPIHIGHLVLAEYAKEEFHLEKVLIVPAARPPHKGGNMASPKDRLEMVRLAVRGRDDFLVSDMEICREGPSYTIDTLRELKGKFPGQDICFIIGGDSLAELATWHEARTLVEEAHFLAAARPGFAFDKEKSVADFGEVANTHIHLFSLPQLDISSTQIRKRLGQKKSVTYLVPQDVLDYIKKEELYAL